MEPDGESIGEPDARPDGIAHAPAQRRPHCECLAQQQRAAAPTPVPAVLRLCRHGARAAGRSRVVLPLTPCTPQSAPSSKPTLAPSAAPTSSPSSAPSLVPTASPSAPTAAPTRSPTKAGQTWSPTASPSASPTLGPTAWPTRAPSAAPTVSALPSSSAQPHPHPCLQCCASVAMARGQLAEAVEKEKSK